jgi:NTE family protein
MNFDAIGFQGGGMKGLAYVGALKRLVHHGVRIQDIKHFTGTSAGSQVAAYTACGYTVEELENIMYKLPVRKFKDNSLGCVRNSCRILRQYGYFKGVYLEKYVDKLIKKKLGIKKATFKDLFRYNNVMLRITGTCLSTGHIEYFDHELCPDMPISKAVHISSCIPIFYSSVKYNDKYYVDGGVLHNLPIYAFPQLNTLFLKFKDTTESSSTYNINNIYDFMYALINITINSSNKLSVDNGLIKLKDNVTLIDIDTKDVSYVDFGMSDDTKTFLMKQGELAINTYIDNLARISTNN